VCRWKASLKPISSNGGKWPDELLGLVHSDVFGKINAQSLSGAQYFLMFIEDKTHYVWVYILKYKSEMFNWFLEWKALWKNQQIGS